MQSGWIPMSCLISKEYQTAREYIGKKKKKYCEITMTHDWVEMLSDFLYTSTSTTSNTYTPSQPGSSVVWR